MADERFFEELHASTFAVGGLLTGALSQSIAYYQRDRARAVAVDSQIAASVHGAASAAWADVASELTRELACASANRDRLQDRCDLLEIERSELLAHCASLLAEVDMLRARR